VLRKIGTTTTLTPTPPPVVVSTEARTTARPSHSKPPQPRLTRPSTPAASRMMRPPPPDSDDDGDGAAPIPLTRLQTPRPHFRSAIDLPIYGAPASAAETSVRETSTSTLPPLVASLPPVSPPLYLPYLGRTARGSRTTATLFWGSASLIAILAVVGGVAVGQRVARPASESAKPMLLSPSDETSQKDRTTRSVAAQVAPPVALPQPAPTAPPALAIEPTPVDALPRAPAAIIATAARSVAPRAQALAAPPRSAPDTASVPATAASALQPARVAVHGAEKDPVTPDKSEGDSRDQVEPATVHAPEQDPLVKAVRDDIEEEEARRKQR
jgi:hypothetical protein